MVFSWTHILSTTYINYSWLLDNVSLNFMGLYIHRCFFNNKHIGIFCGDFLWQFKRLSDKPHSLEILKNLENLDMSWMHKISVLVYFIFTSIKPTQIYYKMLRFIKTYLKHWQTYMVPLSVKRNTNRHKDTVLNHNCTKLITVPIELM